MADPNSSDSVDSSQSAVDDNKSVDANESNDNALLKQLLALTTSLQSSIDKLGETVNELTSHQRSVNAKIALIQNEVFNADVYGAHSRKTHIRHVSNVLNEASNPIGDAKPDVDNLVNKSKPDVGATPINKRSLTDDFAAEGYSFMMITIICVTMTIATSLMTIMMMMHCVMKFLMIAKL